MTTLARIRARVWVWMLLGALTLLIAAALAVETLHAILVGERSAHPLASGEQCALDPEAASSRDEEIFFASCSGFY